MAGARALLVCTDCGQLVAQVPSFLWLRWYCLYQLRCWWLCHRASEKPLLENSACCPPGPTPSGGGDLEGWAGTWSCGEQQACPRTQALSACSLSFCKRPQGCLFAQLPAPPSPSVFFLFVWTLALPPVGAKTAEEEGLAGSPRAVWAQSPQLPNQAYSLFFFL